MVLVLAMRGLVQAAGELAAEPWQRFLDVQPAGMRAAGPLSSAPPSPVSWPGWCRDASPDRRPGCDGRSLVLA